MPELQMAAHSVQSHGVRLARSHLNDWLILLLLAVIDGVLNFIEPFHRFISEAMMTDSSYPLKEETVPFWAVPIYAVLLPLSVFGVYYYYRRDVYDLHHATLGLLFSILITAVITDAIKDAVGRPRPDFFWRCFPDGNGVFDMVSGDVICQGDPEVVKYGYKSFPSGHTSWSFAGFSFLSWYMAGKLRVCDRRGHVSKICVIVLPMLMAALVGVSRVDDYRHHWDDVFAGALLGTIVAAVCYLQFFPYPNKEEGWAPHDFFVMGEERPVAARLNSLRLQRPADTEAVFVGLHNDRRHSGSSSPSTSPV